MVTVEERALVQEPARAEVMVTNPRHLLPGNLIWVADLRKPNKNGEFKVWVEQRGAWLDRVMPKKTVLPAPPAATAPARGRTPKRRPPRRQRPAKPRAVAAATPEPRRQVLMFSAQGCPACRQARQFFTARKVPFLELDLHKDPQAVKNYMMLQKKFGFKVGTIPVLVVNGRLIVGFNRPHIEAALRAGSAG
jgi:glutaredoxin